MELLKNNPQKKIKLEKEEIDPYLKSLNDCNIKYEEGNGEINLNLNGDSKLILKYFKCDNKNKYKKIEQLTLLKDKKHYNLIDFLPENTHIYFSTKTDGEDYEYKTEYENKKNKHIIRIGYPLLSISGILALLHEIGHLLRSEKINLVEKYNIDVGRKKLLEETNWLNKLMNFILKNEFNFKDAELVLKDERGAWAEALKIIRPFLGDFGITTEDLEKIIHKQFLSTYSRKIKKKLFYKK